MVKPTTRELLIDAADALDSLWAAIGDRLLAKGPLSREYANKIANDCQTVASALRERLAEPDEALEQARLEVLHRLDELSTKLASAEADSSRYHDQLVKAEFEIDRLRAEREVMLEAAGLVDETINGITVIDALTVMRRALDLRSAEREPPLGYGILHKGEKGVTKTHDLRQAQEMVASVSPKLGWQVIALIPVRSPESGEGEK